MATNKTDRAFKTLINKRTTSDGKRAFEEFGDRTINVHSSEIWSDDIADNDPAQAVIDGVAELRTLFTLTKDTTVGDDQSWYAEETGVRLKDWISDKYGAGYTAHIYDDFNNEIFPTDESEWLFDYQTGILTFSGDTSGLDKPFRITGYRYIGTKGAGGGGGVTGPGSSTDHAIPRYDGTGGDTLLDSGVTLSDTDAMVFPSTGSISKPGTGTDSEAFGATAVAGGALSVALGNATVGTNGSSSIAIGNGASCVANVLSGICIGEDATLSNAAADYGIIIGKDSTASAIDNIVIGRTSSSSVPNTTVIGLGASASVSGSACVALGMLSSVKAANGIAIGNGAEVHDVSSGDSTGSICLGSGATIGNATPGAGCNAAIAIGEGAVISPGAYDVVAIGAGASISSNSRECTVVGQGASVTGSSSLRCTVIGQGASAAATYGIAIGWNSEAGGSLNATAVGSNTVAQAHSSLAVGASARVPTPASGSNDGGVAVGTGAKVGASATAGCGQGVAIGSSAEIRDGSLNSVAVGSGAIAADDSSGSVVVGYSALSYGVGGVAIGEDAHVNQPNSGNNDGAIAIGDGATVSLYLAAGAEASIAIGKNAQIGQGDTNSIVIGPDTLCNHTDAIAIGRSAQTKANNRCTIGTIGGGAADKELQIGLGFGAWGVAPPGTQPSKINDVTATAGASYTATEQGMLNDLKARLNAIIDVLEGAGLSST